MATSLDDPKSQEQICLLNFKGPGWPEELLVHPSILKHITVPEFEVTCGPKCKCADQIKYLINVSSRDVAFQINSTKIIVDGSKLNQETVKLLLYA